MTANITTHVREDRIDRAVYILTTVGLGNPVRERKVIDRYGRVAHLQVTDTGVFIFWNEPHDKIVTLYIATPEQMSNEYKGHCPPQMWNKALKNRKYCKNQPQ